MLLSIFQERLMRTSLNKTVRKSGYGLTLNGQGYPIYWRTIFNHIFFTKSGHHMGEDLIALKKSAFSYFSDQKGHEIH
jgi:hypothetical protein